MFDIFGMRFGGLIFQNLNRAGFFVIQDFLLSTDTVDANAVAQYRAEVYYESSNIVSVIVSYGRCFRCFLALIIYVHFMRAGIGAKTIALSVVLFLLSLPLVRVADYTRNSYDLFCLCRNSYWAASCRLAAPGRASLMLQF